MVQFSPHPMSRDRAVDLAETGWRMETFTQADGTAIEIMVPLTDAEFLHPQEGYHLPSNTFHDAIGGDAKDSVVPPLCCRPHGGRFSGFVN